MLGEESCDGDGVQFEVVVYAEVCGVVLCDVSCYGVKKILLLGLGRCEFRLGYW